MPHEGVHALVRRTHEERVLRVLREQGALTRAEIARRTGLSRTTLSEIAIELLRRGAIVLVDTDAATRLGSGRPAERLALDPASGQLLGVDFGHRRVHVAVMDASHEVIASGTARYADTTSWEERVAVAFDLLDSLRAETGVHLGALQAVGIGVPGPYSPGRFRARPRNPEWVDDAPSEVVEQTFADRFDAAVMIDNNARLAALAEALDSARETVGDLLYIRLSDGVGGGLAVDGRLVQGSTGLAGELGHVTAVPDGLPCRCGKRGCVETVASAPAILAACRARGVPVQSIPELAEALAGAGRPAIEAVLRETGAVLGRVLAAAAIVLNPAEVVIGGEIVQVSPVLVEQAADVLVHELPVQADSAPLVRAARLGDRAGALGAVSALFHQSPLLAGYPEATTPAPAPVTPLRRSIS